MNPLFGTASNTVIGPLSFRAALDINPEGELTSVHHGSGNRSDLNAILYYRPMVIWISSPHSPAGNTRREVRRWTGGGTGGYVLILSYCLNMYHEIRVRGS